jgi:dTMP kinase
VGFEVECGPAARRRGARYNPLSPRDEFLSPLNRHPMFFSFDGIDGVGKSTQMQLFVEWLTARGQSPVTCRDPGSTPLGEQIRSILLAHDVAAPIGARSEMLLYMAARAQLVDEVIRPALDAGKVVVSDRYLLANIVYQAHAGGLDVETVRQVGAAAVDGIMPDCIFLLDMDQAEALNRMARELDRVESRGDVYRQRLRTGFLTEAHKMGGVVHIINAARDVETIQLEIQQIAKNLFDAFARPLPG